MAPMEKRSSSNGHISPTTLAALLTGIGVIMLGLLVGLAILLVRAIKMHKKLLADLEERGVVISRAQTESTNRGSITKPRTVLRRSTILPFQSKSGWGALPSMETLNIPEPPAVLHYVPPKPDRFPSKPSRLSWPFSTRRNSGKALRMKKITMPRLSTVIESPKPSPLIPVLSGALSGELSSPRKSKSRPSSDQSLLQRHPALRNTWQPGQTDSTPTLQVEPLKRSLTSVAAPATEKRPRPNRANSVPGIPLATAPAQGGALISSNVHGRSVSVCSQTSGNAPDAPAPPPPLEIVRIKAEARRQSLLSRSPSRFSVSSFESAGSSILATQSSPILPRSNNVRVHKVLKRDWKNSLIAEPRPLRHTLSLQYGHARNQQSLSSIKSSMARYSTGTPSTKRSSFPAKRSSVLTKSSSVQSTDKSKSSGVASQNLASSSTSVSVAGQTSSSPRRQSKSQANSSGSPQARPKSSAGGRLSNGTVAPQQQLSRTPTQTSITSSNDNPFQWEPTTLSSGKPSALKGSPTARKGHKRQNCVRISLAPTILGPPSRSGTPSGMKDIQEESPDGSEAKGSSAGLGFSNNRPLPCPPSATIFTPDLKFNTAVRASLSPISRTTTLSMTNFDHGPIGSPLNANWEYKFSENSQITSPPDSRLSSGSVFTLSAFPNPCFNSLPGSGIAAPPVFSLMNLSAAQQQCTNTTFTSSPLEPQYSSPFDYYPDSPFSLDRPLLLSHEYDPEHPQLVYYTTPTHSPLRENHFSSPFSTIPEESSVKSTNSGNGNGGPADDSPPCSPKTIRPPTFASLAQNSGFQSFSLPAPIPEDSVLDTINPAILSKEASGMLSHSPYNTSRSILNTCYDFSSRPGSPSSTRLLRGTPVENIYPSSPPGLPDSPTPSAKRPRSSMHKNPDIPPRPRSPRNLPTCAPQSSPSSSIYSHPTNSSPSPSHSSPRAPSSPRPAHASLPTPTTSKPSLDFSCMPTLHPSLSPRGARPIPARPLSHSIVQLRRMNSDAENGGKGERRYLKLGREDSIALPGEGDSSWLEELDEEVGMRLVGSVLDDWEEEAAMLEGLDSNLRGNGDVAGEESPTLGVEKHGRTGSGEKEEELEIETEGNSAHQILPSRSPSPSPAPETDPRSSSIWEDGEKFWASTPPQPFTGIPSSDNPSSQPRASIPNPAQTYAAKKSSPLSTSATTAANPTTTTNRRKRTIAVARDTSSPTAHRTHAPGSSPPLPSISHSPSHSATPTPSPSPSPKLPTPVSQLSQENPPTPPTTRPTSTSASRYRKRAALSLLKSSPNIGFQGHNGGRGSGSGSSGTGAGLTTPTSPAGVRIEVQPPSSERREDGVSGTPRSLYDADGFLRG